MDFDWPVIIVGFLFSCVGFVYFSFGKRMGKPHILVCGMVLMAFTYFMDGMLATVLVGLTVSGLPFIFRWW